jgi:predicted GNAT family acetyltransferase
MSIYADYIREREGFSTIEVENGFATYRVQGEEIYLRDIYVQPSARKGGLASRMADQVAEAGREAGCSRMVGTCCPSTNGSTESMAAMLAYGFKLHSASNDLIVIVKEL